MRVLVCGGREFDDLKLIMAYMDSQKIGKGDVVIEGGAKGADFLARCIAKAWGAEVEEYLAEWIKYGSAAGGIRNQRMLDEGEPDLVIAFPGGRGTADMVRRAKKAGVEVIKVDRS